MAHACYLVVCISAFMCINFICIMSEWRGHLRRIRFTNTTNISLGLAWWRRALNKEKEKKRWQGSIYKKNSIFILKEKDRRYQLIKHAWLWEEANIRTGMFLFKYNRSIQQQIYSFNNHCIFYCLMDYKW